MEVMLLLSHGEFIMRIQTYQEAVTMVRDGLISGFQFNVPKVFADVAPDMPIAGMVVTQNPGDKLGVCTMLAHNIWKYLPEDKIYDVRGSFAMDITSEDATKAFDFVIETFSTNALLEKMNKYYGTNATQDDFVWEIHSID